MGEKNEPTIHEGKFGEERTVRQLGEEVVDDMTMRDLRNAVGEH